MVICGKMHAALKSVLFKVRDSHTYFLITLHNLLFTTTANESSYTNQSRGAGL